MKNKKKQVRRFVTATLFIIFSSILFINNTTSLAKFNIGFNINLIAWIGLIGSVLYAMWKIIGDEL